MPIESLPIVMNNIFEDPFLNKETKIDRMLIYLNQNRECFERPEAIGALNVLNKKIVALVDSQTPPSLITKINLLSSQLLTCAASGKSQYNIS